VSRCPAWQAVSLMSRKCSNTMMPPGEVIRIIELLECEQVSVWVDGGWGVDALAGMQTRPHDDLDIAVLLSEADTVISILANLGYDIFEDEMPTRLDLRDGQDHRVDLHPITLDANGNGLQQLQNGEYGTYTAEGLDGVGKISGRRVKCLSVSLQLGFHHGYALDDDDMHDIKLLKSLDSAAR
jgi:lincosamide nucleotidyltransferase A/C/D/E